MPDFSLPLILPIGTQIVSHVDVRNGAGDVLFVAGAVGVIVKSPSDTTHAYRIKFMDGTEQSLKRHEFTVRRQHQRPAAPESHLAEVNLYDHVIYQCVIGSRAFGLDVESSDTDLRGFYLPPKELHWSLYGIPEQLEREEETYWEVQKFIILALKANPNVLECLYSPLVQHVTPVAQTILDIREAFLSKLIYQTYNGYVMSQFKKLQYDLVNYGEIRWKHAMHLIRLLLSGISALKTGVIPIQVTEYRDQLLDIRHGQTKWEKIDAWRLTLHREFEEAFRTSALPDRPDYERVNYTLIEVRKNAP